jgi:leucyl aminopeptidase
VAPAPPYARWPARSRVALALPSEDADSVAAVAEGALLGAYAFLRYRASSKDAHKPPVESVTVLTTRAKDKAVKAAAQRAADVAAAVNLTRDLVNTPPSDLHPAEFADAARTAVDGLPVDVTVLDEKALRKGGYGGIVGVGRGR